MSNLIIEKKRPKVAPKPWARRPDAQTSNLAEAHPSLPSSYPPSAQPTPGSVTAQYGDRPYPVGTAMSGKIHGSVEAPEGAICTHPMVAGNKVRSSSFKGEVTNDGELVFQTIEELGFTRKESDSDVSHRSAKMDAMKTQAKPRDYPTRCVIKDQIKTDRGVPWRTTQQKDRSSSPTHVSEQDIHTKEQKAMKLGFIQYLFTSDAKKKLKSYHDGDDQCQKSSTATDQCLKSFTGTDQCQKSSTSTDQCQKSSTGTDQGNKMIQMEGRVSLTRKGNPQSSRPAEGKSSAILRRAALRKHTNKSEDRKKETSKEGTKRVTVHGPHPDSPHYLPKLVEVNLEVAQTKPQRNDYENILYASCSDVKVENEYDIARSVDWNITCAPTSYISEQESLYADTAPIDDNAYYFDGVMRDNDLQQEEGSEPVYFILEDNSDSGALGYSDGTDSCDENADVYSLDSATEEKTLRKFPADRIMVDNGLYIGAEELETAYIQSQTETVVVDNEMYSSGSVLTDDVRNIAQQVPHSDPVDNHLNSSVRTAAELHGNHLHYKADDVTSRLETHRGNDSVTEENDLHVSSENTNSTRDHHHLCETDSHLYYRADDVTSRLETHRGNDSVSEENDLYVSSENTNSTRDHHHLCETDSHLYYRADDVTSRLETHRGNDSVTEENDLYVSSENTNSTHDHCHETDKRETPSPLSVYENVFIPNENALPQVPDAIDSKQHASENPPITQSVKQLTLMFANTRPFVPIGQRLPVIRAQPASDVTTRISHQEIMGTNDLYALVDGDEDSLEPFYSSLD